MFFFFSYSMKTILSQIYLFSDPITIQFLMDFIAKTTNTVFVKRPRN